MTFKDQNQIKKHIDKLKVKRHDLRLEMDRIDKEIANLNELSKPASSSRKVYRGARL